MRVQILELGMLLETYDSYVEQLENNIPRFPAILQTRATDLVTDAKQVHAQFKEALEAAVSRQINNQDANREVP